MTVQRSVFSAFVMTLVSLSVSRGDETAERVATAWAERERQVQTCRWSWTETEFIPKDSPLNRPSSSTVANTSPATDLTIEAKCNLYFEGTKCRYEYTGQKWSATTKTLESFVQTITFDGEQSGLSTLESPLTKNPQSIVKKAGFPRQLSLPKFLPAFLATKPSLVKRDVPVEDYSGTGKFTRIQNRPCVEMQRRVSAVGLEYLFVDLDRDCQLSRLIYYNGKSPIITLTVNAHRADKHGWIPTSWTATLGDPTGRMLSSTKCVVTSIDYDSPLDAAIFRPVTPIGTRVIDLSSGREMHHAILPDGSKGREMEFVPGKAPVAYEDLISQPRQGASVPFWLWIVSCGSFIIACAYLVARRRRTPAST